MKRTSRPADAAVVAYSTRNMPAPLLQRVKARATALRLTIEDAMNLTLEVGLAVLERQASRPARKEQP